MKTYTEEQVDEIIENICERDIKILEDYSDEMKGITNKLITKVVCKSIALGIITGVIIGLMIGSFLC
ncbi:hypothetical protein [Mammaliicoccus vitulinus]|uniref:hypothetical protein n=1 Tax=Mammaliicoccus vitulinus TaxID=71237 RepID=UPI003F9C0C81